MTDYALYILMRNDLPSMTVGRCMAQASHASNAFIHTYGRNIGAKIWSKQTSQGFGTAIVLSVDGTQLDRLISDVNEGQQYMADYVTDPEYGFVVSQEVSSFIDPKILTAPSVPKFENGDLLMFRKEITCGYVFGDRNDLQFKSMFSQFELW